MRINLANKIKRGKRNVLKFGMMVIISKLFIDGTLDDENWLKGILLSLLGIIIFELVLYDKIHAMIPPLDNKDEIMYSAKFAFMLIGTSIIATSMMSNRSLFEKGWLVDLVSIIGACVIWFSHIYKLLGIGSLSMTKKLVANDVGIIILTFVLQSIIIGKLDRQLVHEVIYESIGFLSYYLFIKGRI
jgi:hypothetical protein